MKTMEACPKCGSVYEVEEVKIIFRDKDSFECFVCGQRLASWNGSVIKEFHLVKQGSALAEDNDTR